MEYKIVKDEDGNTKLQVIEQVQRTTEYTKEQIQSRINDLNKAIEAYTKRKKELEDMLAQFDTTTTTT